MSKRKHAGYWTKENCMLESLKYKTRSKFYKGSVSAYNSSLRNGWLDAVCEHMLTRSEVTTKWTYERCSQESLRYETRGEFKKESPSAYNSSLRNGWLDEICDHMIEIIKPKGHWDIKENCRKEALKYKTRTEFRRGSSGAYCSSLRNGWLDDIRGHMIQIKKPSNHWTKENCRKEVLKYKTRTKFQKGSSGAYYSCRRNGWLDEFFPKTEKGVG